MTEIDLEELFEELEATYCESCESEYVVILSEDLLDAKAMYCPFCAEPTI